MTPEVPNTYYRTSAKALILDNQRRFLLMLEEDKWELPGGGIDFGESPQATVKRELHEEAGLIVTEVEDHPSYFTIFKDNDSREIQRVNAIYQTQVKDLDFTKSEECQEITFMTAEEALKCDAFESVYAFAKIYNPNNH